MKIPSKLKKIALALVLLLVSVLIYLYFALYIPGEPDFQEPIASVVSKDTCVYLQLKNSFDQVERFGRSPFWKTLENRLNLFSQTKSWKEQSEKILEQTKAVEATIQQIPLLEAFRFGNILNEEIAVAVRVEAIQTQLKTTVVTDPEILWISKLNTAEKRLIHMALWGLPKAAMFTKFPDFIYEKLGNNIHHFTLKKMVHVPKPGLEKGLYSFQEFYIRRFYNLLLVSNNLKFLEKSLLLIESPLNSNNLASTFAFKEAQSSTKNSDNFLFINNNIHFQKFYDLEKNLNPVGLRFPFQQFYGLIKQGFDYNALSTLVGYWSPDSLMKESRFHANIFMGVNQNKLSSYYKFLYNQEEKPFELLDIIPHDCAVLRAYRTDMVEEWEYIQNSSLFGAYFIRQAKQIIQGGNQEYAQIDRNYFQHKFLPRFGQEYAFLASYKYFPKGELRPAAPLPYIALVFEFPHLQMREELIQFFVRGMKLNDFGEMEEKEVSGKKIYVFPRIASLVEGLNQPCMGFVGRFLVVTTHSDYFKTLIDVHEKRHATLRDQDDFKLMTGEQDHNLLLYLNMRQLQDIMVPLQEFDAENYATQRQRENRQELKKKNPNLSEPEIDKLVERKYYEEIEIYKKEAKQVLDSFNFLNKMCASLTMKGNKIIFGLDIYLNPD